MSDGKKSIFYTYPVLYINGLKYIHKGNFAKRYKYMASFVAEGNTVLEPGCGPAILADYLPKGCTYYGFDANANFVNYAAKKQYNVRLGNVLDPSSYIEADVVIVCDTLHHIHPTNRETFINNCFRATRKIFILCEPGSHLAETGGMVNAIKQRLTEWGERDGTNKVTAEYFPTHSQLLAQIAQGFNTIPASVKRETQDMGDDVIAIFYKEGGAPKKMPSQKTVSAIVPAYNEEKTVAGVVEVLLKSSLVGKVICVNDGSTDSTRTILKSFGTKITFIDLQKNCGKGFALVEGVKQAHSEIVAFIDADLVTLSDTHLETLLSPILTNEVRVVLGYPSDNGKRDMFTHLTGERAYYKSDLEPYLSQLAETRFGVEVMLNNIFDANQTRKVPLKGLLGLCKYEKHSPMDAFKEYLGEIVEIAQVLGQREGLLPKDYQIINTISKATNLRELKTKVQAITNKNIRIFVEKYVLKYMKAVQQWWKNPLS